jgi:hypothetical protein
VLVYASNSNASLHYVKTVISTTQLKDGSKKQIDLNAVVPSIWESGNHTRYYKCDNCGREAKSTAGFLPGMFLLTKQDRLVLLKCSFIHMTFEMQYYVQLNVKTL